MTDPIPDEPYRPSEVTPDPWSGRLFAVMWLTNAVVIPAAVLALRLVITGPATAALAMTMAVPMSAAVWWFIRAGAGWRNWAVIWPVLGASLGFGVGILTIALRPAGPVAVIPWAIAAIGTAIPMALPRPTPYAYGAGGMLIGGFPVAVWLLSSV